LIVEESAWQNVFKVITVVVPCIFNLDLVITTTTGTNCTYNVLIVPGASKQASAMLFTVQEVHNSLVWTKNK